jgi:hypothetical protein
MSFSEAQYNATIIKLNQGLNDLSVKIGEVAPAANIILGDWWVPDFIKETIRWCAERIIEIALWTWNKINEVMVGLAAPVLFFSYAYEWQNVRGIASGVTGQLKPEFMPAANHWSGSAATAYTKIIKPQGDAANKLATIADKTAQVLTVCACAGLAFYLAIVGILGKVIVGVVLTIGAMATGVLAVPATGYFVAQAGIDSAMIWGAICVLATGLGVQAQQLITLHGEAVDNSFFPGGHWPNPVVAAFSDATVTDGDADWTPVR